MNSPVNMNKIKDKRSYKNCCSAGCLNNTFNCSLTFFSLPSDKERRSVWLKLLLREDLEDSNSIHYRVCEKHFEPDYILVTPTRKLLKKFALPSVLLPALEEAVPSLNTLTPQLCTNFKSVPTSATDPQGARKLKSDMSETHTIDAFFALCDKFLDKKLAMIVKEQAKITFFDFRNRYTPAFKVFCLNLYNISPEAYALLGDTLCLPNRVSLVRMCESIVQQPNHIMEVLRIKAARMTDWQRHCCVFIDAVKLNNLYYYIPKEDKIYGFHYESDRPLGPAEYALVAVVKGIFGEYQQLAGYTLLPADADAACVARWTDILIRQLCDVGLNVRVLIPGSNYTFLNSAKSRKVSITSPYFFVNNQKIYYLFDPAQLFVETRDSLMSYDFHFNGAVAKWEDIVQFYEKDSTKQLRVAPKLTQNHMEPSESEQSQAQLAAQVFGAPVAAGMAAYASFGALDDSSGGTISLITKMNDLIQFFNLSSKYDCPSHRNFCDQVHKVYFINSMLNFFSKLKVIDEKNGIDVTSLVTFIESFQITLNSILQLYLDLKMDSFTYELTRELNSDYIEMFFNDVKKIHAYTSWELVTEFRKSYLTVFFKPRKDGTPHNDMSTLFDEEKGKSRKHTAASMPSIASAKNKKKAMSLLSQTVPHQHHLRGTGTAQDYHTVHLEDNIPSDTVKLEQDMEVEDNLIDQIKREQEDFLNMEIKIEEDEISTSSNMLAFIKQEGKNKDEESIITYPIQQEQEDPLNMSFEMEGTELIISSREQEHNYGSPFINQEPDNIKVMDSSSVQDVMLHNVNKHITSEVTKGSTSQKVSTSCSSHSVKEDQQETTSDDSNEEVDDCLLHTNTPESDDFLTMVFKIDEKKNKDLYQKCKEPIRVTDYSILDLPTQNSIAYISSWMLRRCHYWHKECDDFNAYIQVHMTHNPSDTQNSQYEDNCKSDGNNMYVLNPPDDFIKYVEAMDGVFREFFQTCQIYSCNIMANLIKRVKKISFVLPCHCFPIDYAQQLFFRIRLHHTLEYNNQRTQKTFIVPML